MANSGGPVAGFLSIQLCPACFRFTPLCTNKSFINRPNAAVFYLSPRMRECPANMVLVSAWLPVAFPVLADWTASNPTAHCRPVSSLLHARSKARWFFFMTRKQTQLTILPCVPSHDQLPSPCLSTSRHPRPRGYSPLQHPCAGLVRKSRSNAFPARPLYQLHPLPANSSSPFAESMSSMPAWSQLAI